MPEHIAARKTYFLIFALLIGGTALTTGVAYVDLGPFNTVVALLIAMVKASLVGLFFMHLKWSGHLARLAAIAALFWLAILIALSLADYLTRNSPPPPKGWQAHSASLMGRPWDSVMPSIRVEGKISPRPSKKLIDGVHPLRYFRGSGRGGAIAQGREPDCSGNDRRTP